MGVTTTGTRDGLATWEPEVCLLLALSPAGTSHPCPESCPLFSGPFAQAVSSSSLLCGSAGGDGDSLGGGRGRPRSRNAARPTERSAGRRKPAATSPLSHTWHPPRGGAAGKTPPAGRPGGSRCGDDGTWDTWEQMETPGFDLANCDPCPQPLPSGLLARRSPSPVASTAAAWMSVLGLGFSLSPGLVSPPPHGVQRFIWGTSLQQSPRSAVVTLIQPPCRHGDLSLPSPHAPPARGPPQLPQSTPGSPTLHRCTSWADLAFASSPRSYATQGGTRVDTC